MRSILNVGRTFPSCASKQSGRRKSGVSLFQMKSSAPCRAELEDIVQLAVGAEQERKLTNLRRLIQPFKAPSEI